MWRSQEKHKIPINLYKHCVISPLCHVTFCDTPEAEHLHSRQKITQTEIKMLAKHGDAIIGKAHQRHSESTWHLSTRPPFACN